MKEASEPLGTDREGRAERASSRHGSGSGSGGAKLTAEGRFGAPSSGSVSAIGGGSGSGQRGARAAASGAPPFEDWETSDEHLVGLEHRLSEWHSLVDSLAPHSARRSNAPSAGTNPNLPIGSTGVMTKASMVPQATSVGWTEQRHTVLVSARINHRHNEQSAGEVQKLRRFKPDVCYYYLQTVIFNLLHFSLNYTVYCSVILLHLCVTAL